MSVEAAVVAYLEERADEVLEFARELIRTPSPNPPGDERAVADLVTARFHDLGVDDIVRVGVSDERPNLIVKVSGNRPGPSLMLSGHLDTKPAGDRNAWKTDPWDPVLRDGDLIGLGSGDMKAGVPRILPSAVTVAPVSRLASPKSAICGLPAASRITRPSASVAMPPII